MSWWSRRRDGRERGSSLVEFSFLGILFLVPLLWLMLAVFDVQRGMFGVAAATREASRAFVLSENYTEGMQRAEQAATYALADQGIDLDETTFSEPVCGTGEAPGVGCLQAGSFARFTISYQVPLPFVPEFFGETAASFKVENTHITPYGQYRESRTNDAAAG